MPYPTGGYPFNAINGGSPAQNPYFGSISPNGLSLGLVNVNPLVSFQFAKNEFGEKTFKPLVNLHVTPNENLIHKVTNLFKAKKYGNNYGGTYGPGYNQHYHTHNHYEHGNEPIYHHQPHYEHAPHYESGPHFSGPPSEYYPTAPGFGAEYGGFNNYGGFYREGSQYSSQSDITASGYEFDPNTASYYGRSANASAVGVNYANNYANYNQNAQNNQVSQAKTTNDNIRSVSFPNSRRKRSVENILDSSDSENNNESISPKNSKLIEKVIVKCRKTNTKPHHHS